MCSAHLRNIMAEKHARPFSIRVFVPDGDPDGLRIVERSNWTGVGVVFNRSRYKDVVSRPEFERTGVYVLVGQSDETALPTIYVGEGDPVRDRLDQHYAKKDFWQWAVFFVTKDGSLNKAHVQQIEYRLLGVAHAAKRCKLGNSNMPSAPTLSEAEAADVESFLTDMLSIYPLLGLTAFEFSAAKQGAAETLFIDSKGIRATGYEGGVGFVVCKGSQMTCDEQPYIHRYMSALRKDLVEQEVVQIDGQHYVFAKDHEFGSPSTAAGVILGCPMNGRTAWKTSDGRTLKEIQSAKVAIAIE